MNFLKTSINRKTLGNLLIVFALGSLLWMYFPIVLLFVKPTSIPAVENEIKNVDSVMIPKIQAYAQLTLNVDPWNEASYERALQYGVAHAQGTALPGEDGTSYLFAHSALPIWRITHTNTPFLFLDKLSSDDAIYITRNNKKYEYKVIGKKEVWPNEVEYLINQTDRVDLILQTCTPLGTALKRLLVFAIRVE